jgi:flagellar motor switch protein FliN/FliY
MSAEIDRILSLEVPIIVRLGDQTLAVREVLSLMPGAIIELAKTSEEELDLLVNNKQIGSGSAVKVGENFGLRVTYIGDVRERIRALGATAEEIPQDDADTTPLHAGI